MVSKIIYDIIFWDGKALAVVELWLRLFHNAQLYNYVATEQLFATGKTVHIWTTDRCF